MKLSIDFGDRCPNCPSGEWYLFEQDVLLPCLAQQDASAVLDQLFQLITGMMNVQVDGIGIGVPFNCRCGKRYRV